MLDGISQSLVNMASKVGKGDLAKCGAKLEAATTERALPRRYLVPVARVAPESFIKV